MGIKPGLLIACLLTACGMVSPTGGTARAASPVVATVAAAPIDAPAAHELHGVLQAVRQAAVSAQVAGTVEALRVQAGDRVRRGQLLVVVDAREAAGRLQADDAAVARARAELAAVQLHQRRQRELARQGFVSTAAVDQVDAQVRVAEAVLAQAHAARTVAAVGRSHGQVAAPFDGVVLATHVDVGDMAMPGRPLVTVYEPGAMRAVVAVPAGLAGMVQAATQPEVQWGAGAWVAASRHAVMPGADALSQTFEWRLDLPASAQAPSLGTRPGQAVRVHFRAPAAGRDGPPADALGVPLQAVVRRGELTAVYVRQDGGFVLRAVRLGMPLGNQAVVLAGLARGERVAIDGVRAGMRGATAGDER